MNNILNKKIGLPKCFVIFMLIDCAFIVPILSGYTFLVIHNNKGINAYSFLLLLFLLCAFWLIKYLFYSVTATSDGLIADSKFGKSKTIPWHEIIEVRRPRFGIPYELTSVISKNRGKIYLLKSMPYYKQLIELIKERALNLRKLKY